MTSIIYNLQDFDNIKWTSKIPITLPEETIKFIDILAQEVGAPNYVKTPLFVHSKSNDKDKYNDRHNDRHRKKRRDNDEITLDDWTTVRNFQKTEFTVTKEGIEKDINEIRLLINKMTEKTYDKITDKLFTILDELKINDNCDTTYINKIGQAIFNMATTNKFNSNIYAKLTKELISKYDFMKPIINDNINESIKMFQSMTFVSTDEDYDKFCEMNLNNEKRRTMSLFLTNLYNNNIITIDYVFDNILNIQDMIVNDDNMKNKSKIMENEELAENLYILLSNISISILNTHSQWNRVYENVVKVKTVDTKVCLGISPKTKFKHMDILDKLGIA